MPPIPGNQERGFRERIPKYPLSDRRHYRNNSRRAGFPYTLARSSPCQRSRDATNDVPSRHSNAGLEQNTRLHQLILDGKEDSRIAALLERNRTLNPSFAPPLARDVTLIRSVYRTAQLR